MYNNPKLVGEYSPTNPIKNLKNDRITFCYLLFFNDL